MTPLGAWDSCENLVLNVQERLLKQRTPNDIVMNGKVCLVTGGNAGIGLATAKAIAQRGGHVILACRSPERAAKAAQEVQLVQPYPGCDTSHVEVMQLDLSSLDSVRAFCKSFNSGQRRLDVLICNAGLMSPPERQETADGLEMQFQVNFLGHWLLTHQLLSHQRHMRRRQHNHHNHRNGLDPVQPPPGTRVVILSSLTHPAGVVQWKDKQSERRYSPFTSYGLSKLCNIMAAREFEARFARNPEYGRDSAVSVHPGIVDTELANGFFNAKGHSFLPLVGRYVVGPFMTYVAPMFMRTPEASTRSVLMAATAPTEKVAGRYLSNTTVTRPDKFAEDPVRGRELWDLACQLTGVETDVSLR